MNLLLLVALLGGDYEITSIQTEILNARISPDATTVGSTIYLFAVPDYTVKFTVKFTVKVKNNLKKPMIYPVRVVPFDIWGFPLTSIDAAHGEPYAPVSARVRLDGGEEKEVTFLIWYHIDLPDHWRPLYYQDDGKKVKR